MACLDEEKSHFKVAALVPLFLECGVDERNRQAAKGGVHQLAIALLLTQADQTIALSNCRAVAAVLPTAFKQESGDADPARGSAQVFHPHRVPERIFVHGIAAAKLGVASENAKGQSPVRRRLELVKKTHSTDPMLYPILAGI